MKNTNLILGKTSVGKTTGLMFNEVKNIISKNENMVIVDNKEEYYKTFGKKLKENGYNVYVVNYKDASKSNGFNPLLLPYKLYKDNNKDMAINLVKNFAYELMKNDFAIDPFWGNCASDYLTGIILLLFKEAKEEEINLASVQVMISQTEQSSKNNDKLKQYINNLDLTSPEYTFLSPTALSPLETRSGIISVLKTELNKYVTSQNLLNLLCNNEININNLNNKSAIFVIGNSEYNRLTNIILNQIVKISTINNIAFNYIIDNFDTLTKIQCLDDLLENAISNNQKVYVISRNIESINKIYGEFFVDKFEYKIEVKQGDYPLMNVGDYNDYPILENEKNHYFNFMDILNNE